MDNEEEEEEEEGDEDKDKEDITTEKEDTHEIKCDKSISYEDKIESEEKVETDDKLYNLESISESNRDAEVSIPDVNVADDKKRKKERKNEKSKNIKKHYDQDVHSEDYSMWLPPQGQSGDGRTSLNDKYGY